MAEAIDAERLARLSTHSTAAAASAPAIGGPAEPVVQSDLAPDLLVKGDPAEIERIVANLVDNAVRYGGGHVWIRTAASGRQAMVEVRDDGPGISALDQARVFEPFFRVHADESAPPGTGLGLAIASGLATRNGGLMTVESRPGAGASFRLILPAIQ